jgi:hypothetical protein
MGSWSVFGRRSARHLRCWSSPNWNALNSSDHRPWDGLWAVEPHFGKGDIGAKWEELLVIQNGDVYWLDDDTPHIRYWRSHE